MAKIAIERIYPHPRERVWRAITDPVSLEAWLMPNDFRPEVGHHFKFRTDPAPGFDGIVHCEVIEIDAPNKLVFSWKGGPIDTVVTFRLETAEGGTRFRMEQDGFKGLKAWLVSKMLASGNREIYGRKLPAFLDRMADGSPVPDENSTQCMNARTRLLARIASFFTRR